MSSKSFYVGRFHTYQPPWHQHMAAQNNKQEAIRNIHS
jgi:hypothetical protein